MRQLLIDLIEPTERGNKFGLFSAIFVLGNGVGQMLSGFLIKSENLHNLLVHTEKHFRADTRCRREEIFYRTYS